ncbi:myelin-associated glycoprotein-like isoform X2 [Triplophysa dalaica]|uniref:myelin-associated glycoprotein-like isoform X2 n=1 Tax=Triplophysa dalaica TaxID=1582913 RepID=UPI0024DF65CB|nr:myelin-associated glycoprotein-like isoform X2 [Triplophysa dalaica]
MKTSQKIICIILFLQGVRCRDWSISLPEKIEALNGSCLTINCTFDIKNSFDRDLDDTAVGIWFKNNPYSSEQIVLNSSISNNLGKITGHLKDKNCTTDFYNFSSNDDAKLFFRIEGKDGLKYTYATKYVPIHVIDSPSNPTVKMFMGQMEVKEVLEGNAVRLSCSAITLCSSSPPTLTWRSTDRLPINDRRLQQQQNQTEIISDLNFTASHLQHGATFICNITYQLQNRNATAQSNITLRVLYAPKNTSVSVFPSDSVLEGTSVTLTCRSDANPAVLNYTWFRENRGRLEQLQTGQNLTFNVTDRTHTYYYCRAGNQHGTQNTSVLLDIQYAPKNTSVFVFPSNSVLEGTSVTLTCRSDANPAVLNYTWFRENRGRLEQLQTGQNLTFNVTDRTHTYYCRAGNQHGSQNTSVLLDIQYAPKNTSVSVFPSHSVLEGTSVTLTCRSDANPAVLHYTWIRENGGRLEQLQTGQNLTFNVTDRTHTSYYCQAGNQHGSQNTSVLLDIQYAPKISLSSSCCNRADVMACSCEVHGNPSPKVEWHLSGRPVTNSTNTSISEEKLNSTHMRSIITLHHSLTDPPECVGTNEYGNTSKRINLVCSQMTSFNFSFVLVGVAFGVSMIVILCAIASICKRGRAFQNRKPSQNRPEGNTRSISTNENEGEFVYVNREFLSSSEPDTPNHQENLHYASITFTKHKTDPGESRHVSSLDTVYSVVKHSSADVVTNQVKSKNSDEVDELTDSDSQLYAQVKHPNPRSSED